MTVWAKLLAGLVGIVQWFLRRSDSIRNENIGRMKVNVEIYKEIERGLDARKLPHLDGVRARLLAKELGITLDRDTQQLLQIVSTEVPEGNRQSGSKSRSNTELRNVEGAVYRYSKASLRKLATCDARLQRLFLELSKEVDITIVCGHRGEEEQNKAFAMKRSKLKYPNSMHNKMPSLAVDAVPAEAPKLWAGKKDLPEEAYIAFSRLVFAKAKELGIALRWGADWNRNGKTSDETFLDYAHWEIFDA